MKHPEWLHKAKVYAIPAQSFDGAEAVIKGGRITPLEPDEVEMHPLWQEAWARYKKQCADVLERAEKLLHKHGINKKLGRDPVDGRVWLVELRCPTCRGVESPGQLTAVSVFNCDVCNHTGVTHELVREDAVEVTKAWRESNRLADNAWQFMWEMVEPLIIAGLRFISETGERYDTFKEVENG